MESSSDLEKYIISMRREFHQYPELSFKEERTLGRIKEELEKMGLSYNEIKDGGLICDIKGSSPGKTVAVRADMDGLPVTEENDTEFSSKNEGIMHACGHDAHMSMLLGLAKIFTSENRNFNGTVRLIFQRAEEQPPGGAISIIREGGLKSVDYVIGQHVMANYESGKVAVFKNICMANADRFIINFKSQGGHGAYPHKGSDTLIAGSTYVVQLQNIISRFVSPYESAVITVGKFNSGDRYNILSSSTLLDGTVRTFSKETQERIKNSLQNLAESIAKWFNVDFSFSYEYGYPVLKNNELVSGIIEENAKKLMGNESVIFPQPDMGGEDFAYYTEKVPGAYYFLGVRKVGDTYSGANHSPTFSIDESVLIKGTKLMEANVISLLNK
ncbi:M20 metallopeptidase family protein [Caldiplasma sukawensis]